jgi:Spy/CpxP family protein refolding chaperone
MKKIIILTLIVSLATLAGYWSSKKICKMGSSCCPMKVHVSASDDLGLNPAQQKQVDAMDQSFRKEADDICMRACRGRLEILDLIKAPGVDPEIISKKIEEVGALQILLEKRTATHLLEVKKNLNPEQAARYLAKMDQELREAMKGMRMAGVIEHEGMAMPGKVELKYPQEGTANERK